MKKGFFIFLVLYFFVLQAFIIGIIRDDARFYTLGGINFLAFIVILCGSFVLRGKNPQENKSQKKSEYPIVKERIVPNEVAGEIKEENGNEAEVRKIRNEQPISESNIEYIKAKINRTKRKPLAEGSGFYRLFIFLLSVFGFGGLLYLFWDSLDLIAVVIGAIAMLIFIGVSFKAGNLRRKSLLLSIYFWVFILCLIGGICGIIFANNSLVDSAKENISTFVDGLKGGEKYLNNNNQDEIKQEQNGSISGSINEETGAVENVVLSGDNALSGENNNELLENVPIGNENNQSSSHEDDDGLTDQVTLIEAIKHLIVEYSIPLSKSTSTNFKYVSKSSSDYPYMKTALEKKMIGTKTDPNMIVSCEVYIVMKGLAEDWHIGKVPDVKGTYWTVAQDKGALNGCKQGEKLTVANL